MIVTTQSILSGIILIAWREDKEIFPRVVDEQQNEFAIEFGYMEKLWN